MNQETANPLPPATYIDAIDGLRALAVVLVVMFHAGFNQFSGGFVGVDVFFVISGYLITSNLLRDIEAERFTFSGFYTRRVARLLPALFVVISATLIWSWLVLSPDQLERLGQAAIYAALSVSNIFFWSEAGYFTQASETKPLLHTWSLAVEEQFYLVWPAMITLLMWLKRRAAVVIGLLLVTGLSLGFAIAHEGNAPDSVFFLTPYRAFQFGLGALVLLLPPVPFKSLRELVIVIAVAALAWCATSLDGTDGVILSGLLPAVATSLFLLGVHSSVANTMFANTPMRWIGHRSYSIYLVHWPVMVLWKMSTDYEFSLVEGLIAVLLSIALGHFLHITVEKRFRFTGTTTPLERQATLAKTLILLVVPLLISAHFWGRDGYPTRIPAELRTVNERVQNQWQDRYASLRTGQCNLVSNQNALNEYNWDLCLGPHPEKPTWLILGDSHGAGAFLLLREAYPEISWNQMTLPGCTFRLPHQGVRNEMCRTAIAQLLEELADLTHLQGVVISSRWRDGHIYALEDFVNRVRKAGHRPVVMTQRLSFKVDIPEVVKTSISKTQASVRLADLEDLEEKALGEIVKRRAEAAAEIIDVRSVQCYQEGACPVFDSAGELIYLDKNHWSMDGIKHLAPIMRAKYPDLFFTPAP